jgi:probable addiction module antidote protein
MSDKVPRLNVDRAELAAHINRAFETADPLAICNAIGESIRQHQVSDLAEKAGLRRTSIYRSFGGKQSPNFSTVLALLDAMDLQLKVVLRRVKKRAPRRSRV